MFSYRKYFLFCAKKKQVNIRNYYFTVLFHCNSCFRVKWGIYTAPLFETKKEQGFVLLRSFDPENNVNKNFNVPS